MNETRFFGGFIVALLSSVAAGFNIGNLRVAVPLASLSVLAIAYTLRILLLDCRGQSSGKEGR